MRELDLLRQVGSKLAHLGDVTEDVDRVGIPGGQAQRPRTAAADQHRQMLL